MDDGQDGENRGGDATGPHEARPCGINGQLVQRDEDVAAVLQQVQQQRRVAVQHRQQQVEPSPHPHPQRGRSGGGRGVLGVGGAFGAFRSLFPLEEEAELVQVAGQAEDEGEEVEPGDANRQSESAQQSPQPHKGSDGPTESSTTKTEP